ncbi:hypothetical protein EHS13_31010 [Paenibacillus psychroresistens]|uniref:Lipoprotein n=1 Tax=Paenibacillus psychroresistens TaxID=1778678 RepID=A0A6B8RT74_9BACL|nr:hypothetical protein [Paenibacillus psychroresistens]QGQ98994.1 hypothetical protein EHS13_31010 [Paenibacillus psychroresistens]
MRKSFLVGLLLLISMSLLTACDQGGSFPKNKNLNIHLSKPKPDGQNYTVYKKIEDNETVGIVMSILLKVSWENATVSMSRQPDYRINPININPTISYEPVTYAIWISPQKDILEVVSQSPSNYGKLSKDDSQKLLSILQAP